MQNVKNNEARPKFTGSYKNKKRVHGTMFGFAQTFLFCRFSRHTLQVPIRNIEQTISFNEFNSNKDKSLYKPMFIRNAIQLTMPPLKGTMLYAN